MIIFLIEVFLGGIILKKFHSLILGGLFVTSLVLMASATATVTVKAEAEPTTTTETVGNVNNTFIIKDIYGHQLGTKTVTGTKVGAPVDLKTIKINSADFFTTDAVHLLSDGSTQVLTEVPRGFTHLYGVVRINQQTLGNRGALYYPFAGEDTNGEFAPSGKNGPHDNGLPSGSEWKIFEMATWADGEVYYRVDKTDWINEADATLLSTTPATAENSMRKPDRSTIKVGNKIAYLTKLDGTPVKNRALAPNTPWYTDKVTIINNHVMYRVATDEWVNQDDLGNL